MEIKKRAWLLTATFDNWKIAEDKGVFGCHGNSLLLDKIAKYDNFVAFVPEIGFIGKGTITGEYYKSNIPLWKDKSYMHRFQISSPFISNKILPAASVIDDLGFVTNKQKWGVFFRSGIREIPLEDFEIISERLKTAAFLLDVVESAKKSSGSTEIGNKLHNRILKLFENLGFLILENNYQGPGSDIIVSDPEDLETNKILIQCKNSEQTKITFSKLDKILNEYSGRLKTEDAKLAILAISGYKLPNKIPGEQEELSIDDVLKKYGVAIWTEEVLDYYEDLINKISRFARYQVLSDLGLKLNFSEDISVDAIKIVQNDYTMYAASLRPDWLLKSASVVRRVRVSDGPRGYQRLLDKNRVINSHKAASIPHYLDENPNWLFPNAIVLASSRDFALIHNEGKLRLKSKYGQFWVIDGQHRLFAFANADSRKSENKLLCVIIDSQSLGSVHNHERELAQLFVTLNGKAKRVPKALLYELYELLGSEGDESLEVVLRLVKDSFFADCIRGYSDKGGSINLVAFADAEGTGNIYKYFKSENEKKSKDEIVNIVAKFILDSFKELAKCFSSEWANPDEYFLKTDRGVKGILELLAKVLKIKKYDAKIDNVSRIFKALQDSDFDFSSETAKGLYLGAGGPKRLAESFSKHINKSIVDFAPEYSPRYSVDQTPMSTRGDIPESFLRKWMNSLEGDVRCCMMFIDASTIKYLEFLNRNKVKRVRMFFGNCQDKETKIKEAIKHLREDGLDLTLTQIQKKTLEKGSYFHARWIGDDKIQIRTEVDLKQDSQKGAAFYVYVDKWMDPPELDDFERYWTAAETLREDIQFGYDWGSD